MCSPGVQSQGTRIFTAFADQGSEKAQRLLNNRTMRVLLGIRGEPSQSSSPAKFSSAKPTFRDVEPAALTRSNRRGAQRRSFFTRD